ncbi:MAG: protein-disulfide reductase DsbD N-terminal domain-containing protein [Burkholderiales bacterium]|nr:protein-disulfide reductase DsbD N-terminal domain-containing protein [Burkholderiales bacterium]
MRPARRSAFALAALVLAGAALAADPKLLPPEQAFRFSARALDDRTLEARFSVEDGYYLYRDKIAFAVEPAGLALGAVELPPGKEKVDEFFGKVQTYRGDLVVRLPLAQGESKSLVLVADSQGCADVGVCYPVNRQKVTLTLPEPGKGPGAMIEAHPRKKNWFN